MKNLPHIVISSYPGKDRVTRKHRFKYHIKQRIELERIFGDEFDILTCACTYDTKMKKKMEEHKFEAVYLKNKLKNGKR